MKRLSLLLIVLTASAWSCTNPGSRSSSTGGDTTRTAAPSNTDAGLLLVANKLDNTLYFINAETLELVDSTTTGEDPHEAVVTPDGNWAYTANMNGNSLSVIDMATLEEVRRIDLAEFGKPHGLAVSGNGEKLYVTTEGSRVAVLEIEVSTDSILRVFETGQQGTHMVALSKDERTAYAPNLGSGNTTVIDLEAGEVVKTLATGDGTEGIDVHPNGGEVWITARSGSVAVVNTETNEIEATLPADGLPIRVKFTPDGKHALVSCLQGRKVIVFDVADRKAIKEIETGAGPVGVLVRPDGEVAFIANTEDDIISVLDLNTLEITGSIPAGNTPDGMAFR